MKLNEFLKILTKRNYDKIEILIIKINQSDILYQIDFYQNFLYLESTKVKLELKSFISEPCLDKIICFSSNRKSFIYSVNNQVRASLCFSTKDFSMRNTIDQLKNKIVYY